MVGILPLLFPRLLGALREGYRVSGLDLQGPLEYNGPHERLDPSEAGIVSVRFMFILDEMMAAGSFHHNDTVSWGPAEAIGYGIAYPFKAFASYRLMYNEAWGDVPFDI